MFFEEVEIGGTYKAEVTKPITGTEIDIIAQMSGMDLPGFLNGDFARSKGYKDRLPIPMISPLDSEGSRHPIPMQAARVFRLIPPPLVGA